ncbi:MAG: 3-oxoacyl-ACP reductase FabG [Deltaproteobacteria bacterium]|nr:3-oxoacyl-ACP reductase FabG [Deltaproteobacteria bacterium]
MQAYWSEQVALVTGSSRGIGREIALRFYTLGAKVAINYHQSQQKADELLKASDSNRLKIYRADVGNEEDVHSMVEKIERELGSVTILVNNAGITRDNLLMMMTAEEWRSVLATHLDGAFYCTRAVLSGMLANRHGRIINISSVSGVKGTAGQTNYSTAKAGLIGLTKSLSREIGRKNITCNALVLGLIETEMTEKVDSEVLAQYKTLTALKRFGKTGDVADMVEFLSSPKAGYITGQVHVVDGGIL